MTYDAKRFTFPDGQPHVSVLSDAVRVQTIEAVIGNPFDLLGVLLEADALRAAGVETINLDISYLMGARMDRRMPKDEEGWTHPATLGVIGQILEVGGFNHITIFDPHSEVSLRDVGAEAKWPVAQVKAAMALLPRETFIVIPDAGAEPRVMEIMARADLGLHETIRLHKKRDSGTGKLSGFEFVDPSGLRLSNATCIILDDICDGGGTFVGVANLLRSAGAVKVHLYVSHGIFSKGYDIEGIDHIFTTDSYRHHEAAPEHVTVLPWQRP